MIRLTRERRVEAIDDHFWGGRRLEFERELLEQARGIQRRETTKHEFDSKRWKRAKDQLLRESHQKCAYCEAPTSVVAYGDVEHYRPKSLYWWLAYCYENYLASCQLCNQKFKRDHFPTRRQQQPIAPVAVQATSTDQELEQSAGQLTPDPLDTIAVALFEEWHRQERPLLLNPYVDSPEEYFGWRADKNLKEVDLIPAPDSPHADVAEFIEAAELHYGLNRPDLKRERYRTFKTFRTLQRVHKAELLSPDLQQEVGEQLEEMLSPEAAFAGMCRYFESQL